MTKNKEALIFTNLHISENSIVELKRRVKFLFDFIINAIERE